MGGQILQRGGDTMCQRGKEIVEMFCLCERQTSGTQSTLSSIVNHTNDREDWQEELCG